MLESLLEILTNRRPQTFYKHIDVHSVANAKGEIVPLISMWNIVNQLGKRDFSFGQIFLEGRKGKELEEKQTVT